MTVEYKDDELLITIYHAIERDTLGGLVDEVFALKNMKLLCLSEKSKAGGWTIAHLIAKEDMLDQLPVEALTPELLAIASNNGKTVAMLMTQIKPKNLQLHPQLERVLRKVESISVEKAEALRKELLRQQIDPQTGAGMKTVRNGMASKLGRNNSFTNGKPYKKGFLTYPGRPVAMSVILTQVAECLHVDLNDMAGKGRHKRVVLARWVTVHLARRLTTLSYPEIAQRMNRPNHSSVITGHNRLTALLGASSANQTFLGDMNFAVASDVARLTLPNLCKSLEQKIVEVSNAA